MSEQNNLPLSSRSNPFLEPIDTILTDKKLNRRLHSSPLDGVDVKHISKQARYDLLDVMSQEFFVPSLTSTDIASRLYTLVRKSYISRNPTEINARKRTLAVSRFAGAELQNLPWLPGFSAGMKVDGTTGLGKTYEMRKAIDQLPPRIEHGKSEAADWTHFYQVPALYIGMSHDGSIGGLLYQILVALDVSLGTDYSAQRRLTSLVNEKLAVQVGILLSLHAVGVLIIDEIQASNFCDGVRGTFARTFFLRMLNFGIPIVLIGNPKGMRFINSFSQDIRRFSSGGSISMQPFEKNDMNYQQILAPAFWAYNVMPEPPSVTDPDGSILFEYCGGIRDFAGRVIAAAQRIALDTEASSLTKVHLDEAFNGPDFDARERTIIRGFCDKDAIALQDFEDIPWEDYYKKWHIPSASKERKGTRTTPATSSSQKREQERKSTRSSAKSDSPVVPGGTTAYAQEEAKKVLNKRKKKSSQEKTIQEKKESLEAEDMRTGGVKTVLVTALAGVVDSRN